MSQIITNNPVTKHKTGNQYPRKLTTLSMMQKAPNVHSLQQIFNAGIVFCSEKEWNLALLWSQQEFWIERAGLKLFRLYLLLSCMNYWISLNFLFNTHTYIYMYWYIHKPYTEDFFLGRRDKFQLEKFWASCSLNWRKQELK